MNLPPEAVAALPVLAGELRVWTEKLLGPFVAELAAAGGDTGRHYRFRNQIRLFEKTKKVLDKAGLAPEAVEMKVLHPLLNAAQFETDESLHDMWASLLASAASAQLRTGREATYIEILRQLHQNDAVILNLFYQQVPSLRAENWEETGFSVEALRKQTGLGACDFDVSVDNLLRLRLIQHPALSISGHVEKDIRLVVTTAGILCATNLGLEFSSACGRQVGETAHASIPYDSLTGIYNLFNGKLSFSSRWG